MLSKTVRFKFGPGVNFQEAQDTFRLSLMASTFLHGEDRARLDAHFSVNPATRSITVDTTTRVGRSLALVFSGFVRREFGDGAVEMHRDIEAINAQVTGAPT